MGEERLSFDPLTGDEENEEGGAVDVGWKSVRPSLFPRQISFSQRRASGGEILLVILPYLFLLLDLFLFFLLRGFRFHSTPQPVEQ